MSDALAAACNSLLDSAGLSETGVSSLLGSMLGRGADAADIYLQSGRLESWVLENGIVREGNHTIEQGAGLRVVAGDRTGFACTDRLDRHELSYAASNARAILATGGITPPRIGPAPPHASRYPALNPIESLPDQDKLALMHAVDAEARRRDPRVQQVTVQLVAAHDLVVVADAAGQLAADVRPLVRMNVQVIVSQGKRREQGSAGGGARAGLDYLLQQERALGYAREAVRQALVALEATEAPAGTLPVVLGPGWPGVLLHEAIGHGLEADFNRKGTSAFSGRMGERIASPLCTIVDDATLPGRRGSLSIDDEGIPGQCTMLVENGTLCGYMQDRLNARLMGSTPTGNGRRESYAHLPMPRMTNTYMLPGPHDPAEIIASVERGLYAVNFGGGQVDITSGKFVFSASEAYLIEHGRVTRPVKGATLIGNGPDILTRVSMVGNDLELDPGIGICGKEGQSVPVGVGQPTLKIDAMTLGGTSV
jgi:TldD protein